MAIQLSQEVRRWAKPERGRQMGWFLVENTQAKFFEALTSYEVDGIKAEVAAYGHTLTEISDRIIKIENQDGQVAYLVKADTDGVVCAVLQAAGLRA